MHVRVIVISKKKKDDMVEHVLDRMEDYLLKNVACFYDDEGNDNPLTTDGFMCDPTWVEWSKNHQTMMVYPDYKIRKERYFGPIYKGDVHLMTEKIYKYIKRKLHSWVDAPDDLREGDGYVYLEGDEITKDLIGKAWVASFDFHR